MNFSVDRERVVFSQSSMVSAIYLSDLFLKKGYIPFRDITINFFNGNVYAKNPPSLKDVRTLESSVINELPEMFSNQVCHKNS